MDTLIPLDRWQKADKTGWQKLIERWNRTKGFIKHIPSASYAPTSLMRPSDARNTRKAYQKAQKKPLYAPVVAWTEVMQHLPYRYRTFPVVVNGEPVIVNGQVKEETDYTTIVVDNDFLDLLRLQKKIHSPKHV